MAEIDLLFDTVKVAEWSTFGGKAAHCLFFLNRYTCICKFSYCSFWVGGQNILVIVPVPGHC